jgi:hypothetical protein
MGRRSDSTPRRGWFGGLLRREDPVGHAHALFDQGRYAEAAALYESALTSADHATPALWVNAAYSRLMLGENARAVQAFTRALGLQPGFAPALIGLGDAAARRNAHAEAIPQYDMALAQDPPQSGVAPEPAQAAIAHNNRAQSLFALGRMAEAWADAEWRYRAPAAEALYPHRIALPRWQGESLRGPLLVHWEQGFGDIIQHLRFLPLVAERAEFVFECPPPLLRLARRLLPERRVVEARATAPDVTGFAAYVPLASLPHVLGLSEHTLPRAPYLGGQPTPAITAQLTAQRPRGAPEAGRIGVRIGVVWRASAFDVQRNAALADVAPLASLGTRLVSLQKDASAEESAALEAMSAVNAAPALADFAATADWLAALDAVVTVDTSVAHLAGAMGKPAWVLLNEPAAVRWMLERSDSPWYPSLRLLRKPAGAPWSGLVGEAARLLAASQP